MEQKDYILREIQKIGAMMSAIRQKLFGGKDNLAISIEQDLAEAKGMLLSEIDFDLDNFLNLNEDDSLAILKNKEGFNNENIEELATILSQIGFKMKCEKSKVYLTKAFLLYQFVNQDSKTFSLERENRIAEIKNAL